MIATGGAAAAAVGAAALAGLGAGGAAELLGNSAADTSHDVRERVAAEGELVLSVRANAPERQALARTLMEAAGATRVEIVCRTDGTIEPA